MPMAAMIHRLQGPLADGVYNNTQALNFSTETSFLSIPVASYRRSMRRICEYVREGQLFSRAELRT